MLATLLPIDSGEATVAGVDVRRQPAEVRRHIGYVGQFGGADGLATGREDLMLQGRLNGMGSSDVKKRSEELINVLDLKDFADLQTKHLLRRTAAPSGKWRGHHAPAGNTFPRRADDRTGPAKPRQFVGANP